jgi:energy-coupling factor transport system substrate-specific component
MGRCVDRGGVGVSWLAASLVVLAFVLVSGFAWYERSHPSARVLALIAALAALAALGRIAFAPTPQIKPTTDIVLLTGYALGGAPGFAVGAVAGFASNVFFGQGPWTPWQMGAWGVVGIAGALLARFAGRREPGRLYLAAACAAAGLLFGGIMNFSMWATFAGDHSLATLAVFASTSLPFDLAHAAGNVAFCLLFGPDLVRALRRYQARFEVTWRPAPAAGTLAAVALVAGLVAGALAAPPAARAAVPQRSVDYLRGAQNADGGFGGAPGQGSNQLHTGWAALGLAAAGRNPLDVRRGDHDVLDYVAAGEVDDVGELERTILVYAAAGQDAGALAKGLAAKQRRDGSFAGRVNHTAFGILALRAAGRPARGRAIRRAGRWLARQANRDGGFNFAGRGGPSGVDDTGAALQGLAAAGRRRSKTVRRRLPAAAGRGVQRPVDRLGGAGAAGRGARPRRGAPRRLADPARLPALSRRIRRRGPLLADQPADAGVGDRAGAHGAGPQAVPARRRPAGAALPRRPGPRRGAGEHARGHPAPHRHARHRRSGPGPGRAA